MIQVDGWTLLLYYLAGVLTPFAWVFFRRWQHHHPPKEKKTWSAIDNLRWEWEFDHDFEDGWTPNDIGIETARLMRLQLERKPLPRHEIRAGKYTVKLSVNAAFVKRD